MTPPRDTAPTTATATLAVTDASAKAIAAAVLAGSPADPRIAALCRWILATDVTGLRRGLAAARTEAALARDDFHRLRALRADRELAIIDPDTIDDDLSDAVPLLLEDDETSARQVPTLRIQRAAQGRSNGQLGPKIMTQVHKVDCLCASASAEANHDSA